jgi:hypothetical protein
MFYRLIQRTGTPNEHKFTCEGYDSLWRVRQKAATIAVDYLIEDCFGNPVEYGIS